MKVGSRRDHPLKMLKFQKELKFLYHLGDLGHGLASPISPRDSVPSECIHQEVVVILCHKIMLRPCALFFFFFF